MTTAGGRFAAVFVCGAALSAFACGDSSEQDVRGPDRLPDAGADGSSPLEPSDATVPDAELDVEAPAPRRCNDEGWCTIDVPADQDLSAVWGDGQGTVWTAGSCIDDPAAAPGGTFKSDACILRWNGTRFEKAFSIHGGEGAVGLVAIWGSGPTDIWAGGTAGLFHGTGATSATVAWTRVELATPLAVRSIWGTSANDVWLTGTSTGNASSAQVLHYTDEGTGAGAAWTVDAVSSLFSPDGFPLLVFGRADDDVWVTGASATNRRVSTIAHRGRSPEGGVAWADVTPPESVFTQLVAPYGGEGLAAYSSAGLAVADGEAWLAPHVIDGDGARHYPARLRLGAAAAADAGADLTLFSDVGNYSADGAWDTIHAFWGTSSSDVWFVAEHGRVRHWDGMKWTLAFISPSSAPLLATLKGIWGAGASGDIWVVGDQIALRRATTNTGAK